MTTEIEAILNQQMTDNQVPGVSLGIVKDGEVAYDKGFGVAEVGYGSLHHPPVRLLHGLGQQEHDRCHHAVG